MDRPQTKCESLPVEVLCKIFKMGSALQFHNYILVCKSWLIPAQLVLYSTTAIYSLSQLQKFRNTVKENAQLGRLVKIFILRSFGGIEGRHDSNPEQVDSLMADLLSTCLPNLQDYYNEHSNSYTPVLNALLNSSLKHLKRISTFSFTREKSVADDYAICALLMKERIEKLEIKEIYYHSEVTNALQPYLNRLYYQLDQFSKLVDLKLNMRTNNDIQVLEYATENCKTLKNLNIYFYPSDDQPSHNNLMSVDAILNVAPANNVEKLDANVTLSKSFNVLLYLMHKFPRVRDISIQMLHESSILLDRDILVQLINYSSRVESFYACALKGEGYALFDAVGDYWDAKSTLGGGIVQICYGVDYENGPCLMDISKVKNDGKTFFCFTYPLSNLDWKYIDFIEKSGKYIGEFRFRIETDEDEDDIPSIGNELPANFITHTFTHCPNLKTLYLDSCILRPLTHSNIDFRKRLSLDKLYLDNCFLRPGALDQLSLILPRLKKLRINNLTYSVDEDPDSANRLGLHIVMSYTRIDLIILEGYYSPTYIKVFVVSDGIYCYYRLIAKRVTLSNEEEYTSNESHDHLISICCQNQPKFQFCSRGFFFRA